MWKKIFAIHSFKGRICDYTVFSISFLSFYVVIFFLFYQFSSHVPEPHFLCPCNNYILNCTILIKCSTFDASVFVQLFSPNILPFFSTILLLFFSFFSLSISIFLSTTFIFSPFSLPSSSPSSISSPVAPSYLFLRDIHSQHHSPHFHPILTPHSTPSTNNQCTWHLR